MTGTAHTHPTMTSGDWLAMACLSVLWGGSFFFVAVAVGALPPLTIVAARVLIAAVTLWAVIAVTGQTMPRSGESWRAFFGMGLLNNAIPFTLIVWAQAQIPSGLASVLNATTPLFGVVVAHWLTADEKLTPARLAGVLCGMAGVAVMIGPAALAGLGGDKLLAQLAVLGAALSYAFSGVFGRRFRQLGITPVQSAAGQLTASSLMLLPLALLIDRPWLLQAPSTGALAAVLGLALLSTALAYLIFFRLLASAGATNLLLVTFLIPVSAILLGVALLGETIEPRQIAGMALIAAGLAAIDGRAMRRLTAPHAPGSR